MKVEKAIVVNFTEKDKDALRGMYEMAQNCECQLCDCPSCPFYSFCTLATCRSDNAEEFIENIRKAIEYAASDN